MTSTISAPSSLIMGPPGSGKTSAIATYGKAGIETFVLFTEPRGEESLLDAIRRVGAPLEKFHWHTITTPPAGWKALTEMAKTVRVMDYVSLSTLKSGIEKQSMKQLEDLLTSIADFPCDRTGKRYGDVTTWGPDKAFVVDSMTGLNELALLTTVGYKPTAHEGEWGVAMNLEKELIHKLTSDCTCFLTFTAHIDREPDLITGGSRIMVSMLGRKLAPKIPAKFSEVVRSVKTVDGFFWSTLDNEADLKNRSFPLAARFAQDFGILVRAFREREAQVNAGTAAPAPSKTII